MVRDALRGLRRPRKTLPCKYFYDDRGCHLFDEICGLDEYYLTRTEMGILRERRAEIAAAIGPGAVLVEFGAGSGWKTRLVLESLDAPAGYVPIDIAADHLRRTVDELRGDYPRVQMLPICADFVRHVPLPDDCPRGPRTVFFPGSTIGNFRPAQAARLLGRMADVAGAGGGLLIGIDLAKDRGILERAYDDARGVTAEFNLNLLRRLNREAGADFDIERFRHESQFNARRGRVEMRLRSLQPQVVRLCGERIEFAEGEAILTELSHKYELAGFERLLRDASFEPGECWTDSRGWFAVLHARVRAAAR